MTTVRFTHIDTACCLLEINGYRILTDPVLDLAGGWYYHGSGGFSRKEANPAIAKEKLPPIDLVLLSHHQHKDNFDRSGQAFASNVPLVLSTKAAQKVLPGIKGLDDWDTFPVGTDKVRGLKITAMPAQHHPWWVPEFLSGKVIGFMIEYDEQRNGALYISGDTVYFHGIDTIAQRYKIDTAIFHVGAVQFRYLTGFGQYTMNGKGMLKSARIMQPNRIIPIHFQGWSHFKEKEKALRTILSEDPAVNRKVMIPRRGEPMLI